MDPIHKHHWQVALFAFEIVLLTTFAFFTGMIYKTSRPELLVATFLLGASGIVRLVRERSRIL